MLQGTKFHAHCLRWRVGFDIPGYSVPGGLEVSGGGLLTSYWTPDALTKNVGISLSVSTSTLGTDYVRVVLDVPDLGIYESHDSPGFSSSAEAILELDEAKVINAFIVGVGYVQYFTYDEARLYLNGTLRFTGGASSIYSERFTAAGIPLIGVPPTLAGGAGFSPSLAEPSYASCSSLLDIDVEAEIYGGWEIQWVEDGPFVAAPINVTLPSAPDMPEGCSCGLPEETGIVSTYNTSAVRIRGGQRVVDACELIRENETCDSCSEGQHATVPLIRDVYRVTRQVDNWSGSVMLLPDVEKSVRRWKPSNYAQLVFRAGFPQVKAAATSTCGEWGGDTDSNTTGPEVYPEVATILSLVQNSTHAIEDVMERPTIAPASITRSRGVSTKYETDVSQFVLCTFGAPAVYPPCEPIPASSTCYAAETLISVNWVQDGTENPYILPVLDHIDDICRYIDTVCSPHWSYFTWFPYNTEDTDFDSIPDAQTQWQVDGDDVDVKYWLTTRQQYGYQDDLPTEEKTKRRISMPMDPLYWGHLSPLIESVLGPGVYSNWFGQQNYEVWDKLPPTSLAYNESSADLFTGTNCTLSFGPTGVTVTPDPGETSLTVEIDQGTTAIIGTYPYGYPLISAQVKIELDPDNVASFAASWVSVLGPSIVFATSNGTYARPSGVDGGYAFSLQDNTGGIIADDTGTDSLPSGNSSATMADAVRVHGFLFLQGRGALKLRFSIEAENDTDPILIKWPELFMSTMSPVVIDENGSHQVIAWPDGPAVRVGNVEWMISGAISAPSVRPPGYPELLALIRRRKASLVDTICTTLFLCGEDPFGAASLVSDFLDADEYSTLQHADDYTLGLFIDNPDGAARRFPLVVMVPTYRESPPSVGIPLPARDDEKQPTGDLAQQCWSHAEERILILANRAVHLWIPGGAQFTSLISAHTNWTLTGHSQPLENDEDYYDVKSGAVKLAEHRPWHGIFGVVPEGVNASCVAQDELAGSIIKAVARTGDTVIVTIIDGANAAYVDEVDTGLSASWVGVKWKTTGAIVLGFVDGTDIKRAESTDSGETWTVTTIGTGFAMTLLKNRGNDELYYWVDSGTIKGARYNPDGSLVNGPFTVVASGVDDAGIGASERIIGTAKREIVLSYVSSGSVVTVASVDGENFS